VDFLVPKKQKLDFYKDFNDLHSIPKKKDRKIRCNCIIIKYKKF
jgi:hypothetical protein